MFSGQFTDALQALIDWLYRVEPQLAEDQPVHGDIDLVMNLIDNHKVLPARIFYVYTALTRIQAANSSLLNSEGVFLRHRLPTEMCDWGDAEAIFKSDVCRGRHLNSGMLFF